MMDLATLDPSRPDRFADGSAHEMFAKLRREAPVHYCADGMFGPFWSISLYDDIVEIESKPQLFSSEAKHGVRTEHQRVTRAWFFAQDGGHYVQCKYGSKPLALNKDGNAVFVKQITEVTSVLQAFYAAAAAGEFDVAIADAAKRLART